MVEDGQQGFEEGGTWEEMLNTNFCHLSVCYNTFKTKNSKCYLTCINVFRDFGENKEKKIHPCKGYRTEFRLVKEF